MRGNIGGNLNGGWHFLVNVKGGDRRTKAGSVEDPLLNWTRPPREDCPICMLPLPFKFDETEYKFCCGKTMCLGCIHDQMKVAIEDGAQTVEACGTQLCPFCRTTRPADSHDSLEREMKRAKAGNGEAMCRIGVCYFTGSLGDSHIQQDKVEGIRWYNRAAEVGSAQALFFLGICYDEGNGVVRNIDTALEYYQKAAELGKVESYTSIGSILLSEKGVTEEAMLNVRKAVMCGLNEKSLFDALRKGYKRGYITKEEYAFTLRENQKASDEMKSEAREVVRKFNHEKNEKRRVAWFNEKRRQQR